MHRPLAAALLLFALAAEARADDPLEGVDGMEDWYRPRTRRRPVETQRTIRQRAELDATARDFARQQARLEAEQAEFVEDFLALERCRRRRGLSAPGAASRPPQRTAEWLADEERRLERAAERALRERAAERQGLPSAAAEAAFGSGRPAAQGASSAAPQASEPEDARALEARRAEQERRRAQEQEASERAQQEQRQREREAARRLGGRLDDDGQFIDPDLEGP